MSKARIHDRRLSTRSGAGGSSEPSRQPESSVSWYLETQSDGGEATTRFRVTEFPFCVGRSQEMELVIPSISVSSCHAEINRNAATGALHVRDLSSTNGTFVNRNRVHDSPIFEGDVIHFADVEFRLRRGDPEATPDEQGRKATTLLLGSNVDIPNMQGVVELVGLMRGNAVIPLYQEIVRLADGGVEGYEALARGRHPRLPESPMELFRIAAGLGVESELSRSFRHRALEAMVTRPELPALFLNTHPKETAAEIIKSVPTLRKIAPRHRIVLEVHERVMADSSCIRRLSTVLKDHDIGLAYDDFGAGESRLLQLAEVPPDFLKFDLSFIRGIDRSPKSKRSLLKNIVAAAHEMGSKTVAEGVETQAEAEECQRLGFSHAQGFLFGRPRALEDLTSGPAA